MSGNLLVRFDEGRVGRTCVSPSLLLYWEPYRQSIEQWAPRCRIVYDKFHIIQHANRAG